MTTLGKHRACLARSPKVPVPSTTVCCSQLVGVSMTLGGPRLGLPTRGVGHAVVCLHGSTKTPTKRAAKGQILVPASPLTLPPNREHDVPFRFHLQELLGGAKLRIPGPANWVAPLPITIQMLSMLPTGRASYSRLPTSRMPLIMLPSLKHVISMPCVSQSTA